jgi:hypothetical protein
MRSIILTAGTALALCTSPAFAGGARTGTGQGLLSLHGLRGDAALGRAQRSAGSPGDCLCKAAGSALGAGRAVQGVTRMPRRGVGVAALTNSVVGLGNVRVGHGRQHGGQAIGLAGVVTGNGVAALGGGHKGIGLAGTVTASVGESAAGLAGNGYQKGNHYGSLVNVSVLNANAGKSGRLANVALLNGKGPSSHSAISVAALNGSGGTAAHGIAHDARGHHGSAVNVTALNGTGGKAAHGSAHSAGGHRGSDVNVTVSNGNGGKGTEEGAHGAGRRSAVNVSVLNAKGGKAGRIANVSILNGKGTHGRSAINVAALNRTGGSTGGLLNVAVLNGAATGIRLINGVPCLADGTPLTGAAAAAALISLGGSGSHGAKSGADHGQAQSATDHRLNSQATPRAAAPSQASASATADPQAAKPATEGVIMGGPSDYLRRTAANKD